MSAANPLKKLFFGSPEKKINLNRILLIAGKYHGLYLL